MWGYNTSINNWKETEKEEQTIALCTQTDLTQLGWLSVFIDIYVLAVSSFRGLTVIRI